MHRVLEATSLPRRQHGRAILHSLPTGYSLDGAGGIRDPKGMMGDALGVDMHVVSADSAALSNLLLAVERCHLAVEAVVATPYASGLAVLVDDEAELGATVLDLGAGTIGMGVFRDGRLVHADGFALGGHHITMDIARGLNARLADAERLKTLYGSAHFLAVGRTRYDLGAAGRRGGRQPHPYPDRNWSRIIRPRVEEILEMVRDRLKARVSPATVGRPHHPHRRLEPVDRPAGAARRILGRPVRIGRPLGMQGLPESAKSPPSRRRPAFWSIRNSPQRRTFRAEPRRAAVERRARRLFRPRRTMAEREFLTSPEMDRIRPAAAVDTGKQARA